MMWVCISIFNSISVVPSPFRTFYMSLVLRMSRIYSLWGGVALQCRRCGHILHIIYCRSSHNTIGNHPFQRILLSLPLLNQLYLDHVEVNEEYDLVIKIFLLLL